MKNKDVDDTSRRKRLKRRSESPQRHLEDGQTTVSSALSEHQEGSVSTTSKITSITPPSKSKQHKDQPKKKSAIVGSPPLAKRKTSKDKSSSCKKNSRNTKSSRTSVQESTSKEKVSKPSWSLQAKDASQKLWLPTETDCVVSHSNWLNGSFTSTESNSWFSIDKWIPQETTSLQRTSLLSSTFSIAESMEDENIKVLKRTSKLKKSQKEPVNRAKKIRLSPPKEVSSKLKQWFGSVRFTYNWALSCMKAKPYEYRINAIWLRKRFVNKCNIGTKKRFLLDTPKHIRDSAIMDLVEAYKSNFTKKKKDKGHQFEMHFRTKKKAQSITIPSEQLKLWDVDNGELKMYPTFLVNKIKFHVRKLRTMPEKVVNDCKLILDELGRFYLMVTYHDSPCESQAGKESWCSIDTGVRTMLTVYSPTPGVCYKIGKNDISRILRLCLGLDKLISRTKGKRQRRKRKAQLRMRERIKNLVNDVHCKAVKWLLTHFENIIIPPFQVSQMVKRSNRKINSKTVRQMLCWRHYAFRQRLIQASKRTTNVKVYVRGEEYTSKTCTHCHTIKHNLGGAKRYKCANCGLLADRDVCGARNIFVKNTALGIYV